MSEQSMLIFNILDLFHNFMAQKSSIRGGKANKQLSAYRPYG